MGARVLLRFKTAIVVSFDVKTAFDVVKPSVRFILHPAGMG